MDGRVEAKAGLRIAYSNQKPWLLGGWVGGWVDGWMDGSQSWVKDCLQQSKNHALIMLRSHLKTFIL